MPGPVHATETDTVDLSVELCGVPLTGPLLLGSGGLGESAESLAPFQRHTAAVVTRTLRLHVEESRRVFPSPHLALGPRRSWLLNCEWGNLRPFDYWMREGLPQATAKGPVIVSLSGRHIDSCVELCRRLDGVVPLFEVNLSCSHAGEIYGRIADDLAHVSHLTEELKRAVATPVMIKLGWSPVLIDAARAAAESGADAIVVTNSIGPGLDLQLPSGRPRLGLTGGIGGITGPALFPIALACVHKVVEAVDIPVVGVGGVTSYADIVKMLLVGATCVEVYTAALLRGPAVFEQMNQKLLEYLLRHGYRSVAELRGVALRHLRAPTKVTPAVPVVNQDRCHPCGLCAKICPHNAISIGRVAEIHADTCTGCGMCIDACPPIYAAISTGPDDSRPPSGS